jgi:hypothetical protein
MSGNPSQDSASDFDPPARPIALANHAYKPSVRTIFDESRVHKCLQAKHSKNNPNLQHLYHTHSLLLNKALALVCGDVDLEFPRVGFLDHSNGQVRDKP